MQFRCGGHIFYWSRIRKFVTYRIRKKQRTNRQTEKPITEAILIAIPMESRVEQANTVKVERFIYMKEYEIKVI